MRRIGLILAVVLAGSLVAVTVAIGSGTRSVVPAGPIKAAAALAYDPGPGATGVNPTAPIGVRVSGGSFADVALRDAEGTAVEGALSDDRTRWTAAQPLALRRRPTRGRAPRPARTATRFPWRARSRRSSRRSWSGAC